MSSNFDRYEKLTDEQLVKKSADDRDAQSVLIARYLFSVKAYALKISPDSAEDLMQEGLMGLLSAVKSYNADKGVSFYTYAMVCIKNKVLSSLKKNMLSDGVDITDEELEGYADFGDIPEDIVIEKETAEELNQKIFPALSELEQQVFQLFLNGMSYNHIALELGISPKAADNAMQRVRRKLKSLLG